MHILRGRPFETYHYYKEINDNTCPNCQSEKHQYLLRYRTYLGVSYPLIRTRNTFYTVCGDCFAYKEIENESLLMILLKRAKNIKANKYNKFSILDLEKNASSMDLTFSVKEMFEYNLIHHIKDMKD